MMPIRHSEDCSGRSDERFAPVTSGQVLTLCPAPSIPARLAARSFEKPNLWDSAWMTTVTHLDARAARARIRGTVSETPVVRAYELEAELGRPVYLKCELFQVTGSFKAHGALN